MIRERCSCGAEFETDEDNAVALLKVWRREHRHQPDTDLSPTSGVSQVEQVVGFQVNGLSVPVRTEHLDDDEA